jgi:hypothetical protein
MDFAFGNLSTDELKQYHHQVMRQGVRHGHEISPRLPAAHEPVTLYATVGEELSAEAMACYYTIDGTEPVGRRGVAENGEVVMFTQSTPVWDNFAWGYIGQWAATQPGFASGTQLRYRIGAWSAGGDEVFADYPDQKFSIVYASDCHFVQGIRPDSAVRHGDPQPGTVFALNIGQPPAPSWAHEAIIYHLMPDRFRPGNGRGWLQTEDLSGICGGTLLGVIEGLDYIADLGANCIWISPPYVTPSWHGYDTADYREIEPRLGDKETVRRLIDAAHDRGLRVLFDMACNHVSNHHPIFQAAQADSRSPYRDWFTFDDSEVGYQGFFGVASMPEINLTHPDARDWMVENGLYWVREFDIDGYRLDYASGCGPDFWTYFVGACKTVKPDTFYMGEITDPPDIMQSYVGRLDGLLDFPINHALRQTYAWKTWSKEDLRRFLARHQQYMPAEFVTPAFIDNHDMNRFHFVTGGDRAALLAALEALVALPNPPVILYGTEVGLSQRQSYTEAKTLDAVREPMLWGDQQDKELLEKTRALIRRRRR